MRLFFRPLFQRIRSKHPKELKAIFISLIFALAIMILFQFYLYSLEQSILTSCMNSVTENSK